MNCTHPPRSLSPRLSWPSSRQKVESPLFMHMQQRKMGLVKNTRKTEYIYLRATLLCRYNYNVYCYWLLLKVTPPFRQHTHTCSGRTSSCPRWQRIRASLSGLAFFSLPVSKSAVVPVGRALLISAQAQRRDRGGPQAWPLNLSRILFRRGGHLRKWTEGTFSPPSAFPRYVG